MTHDEMLHDIGALLLCAANVRAGPRLLRQLICGRWIRLRDAPIVYMLLMIGWSYTIYVNATYKSDPPATIPTSPAPSPTTTSRGHPAALVPAPVVVAAGLLLLPPPLVLVGDPFSVLLASEFTCPPPYGHENDPLSGGRKHVRPYAVPFWNARVSLYRAAMFAGGSARLIVTSVSVGCSKRRGTGPCGVRRPVVQLGPY